jgi:diadenylate cyclase
VFPDRLSEFLEILLIFLIVLPLLKFLRGVISGNVLRMLAFVLAVIAIGAMILLQRFRLEALDLVFKGALVLAVFTLLMVFQPELRRGLIKVGRNPVFGAFLKRESSTFNEVVRAVRTLRKDKIGALIALEREIGLGAYIEGGVNLDAEVRNELIDTIFWPGTALHDGAIVVQSDRIAAAACLFPLTDNPDVSKRLGTRHRAAIGLSEETDAVVIVVSEETGQISLAVGGTLFRGLEPEDFEERLRGLLQGDASPRPRRSAS